MGSVLHSIDQLEVTFDDESLVANAGLITPATLMWKSPAEGLAALRSGNRVLAYVHDTCGIDTAALPPGDMSTAEP